MLQMGLLSRWMTLLRNIGEEDLDGNGETEGEEVNRLPNLLSQRLVYRHSDYWNTCRQETGSQGKAPGIACQMKNLITTAGRGN